MDQKKRFDGEVNSITGCKTQPAAKTVCALNTFTSKVVSEKGKFEPSREFHSSIDGSKIQLVAYIPYCSSSLDVTSKFTAFEIDETWELHHIKIIKNIALKIEFKIPVIKEGFT